MVTIWLESGCLRMMLQLSKTLAALPIENKVYGSSNVTLNVELAVGVDVESVLEALERATIEDGLIGAGPESYCLVLLCTYHPECHVFCDKTSPYNSCSSQVITASKLAIRKNQIFLDDRFFFPK